MKDDNDKRMAGERLDPLEGTEEYQPKQAKEPTPIDDNEAPLLSELYGVAQLREDQARELVSLAALPAWPGCQSSSGHGWGEHLDQLLGGGVCPGYLLGVGASSAGAGKTAWLMQLCDGLALRNAQLIRENKPGPLTPLVIVSEMSPQALSWRSLARWTSRDARIFRAGQSAARLLKKDELYPQAAIKEAWSRAEEALLGELAQARAWIRFYSGQSRGPEMMKAIDGVLTRWVSTLQAQHPGRPIWPVVVVDPIQRFQAKGDEVEALNELVECIGIAANQRGWVVLLTSDTNKPSASSDGKKDKREEGAAAFRGSYKLQHLLDAALYLTRPEDNDKGQELELVIVKNRWGSASSPWPRYRWEARFARFEAISKEVTIEKDKTEKAARANKAEAKKAEQKTKQKEPTFKDMKL